MIKKAVKNHYRCVIAITDIETGAREFIKKIREKSYHVKILPFRIYLLRRWIVFFLNINHHRSSRVKSGNFGHQVNSDIHLQTVEIQMRRLLMSRLIRIFTVCLVN